MKIYVLGSTAFTKEMVDCKNQLVALGHDAWISPDYERWSAGEESEVFRQILAGEHSAVKIERNYLRRTGSVLLV